jgi:hypothetical protein
MIRMQRQQPVWPSRRNEIIAALVIFATATYCCAANQPAQAPSTDASALIRAQFPYGTNTTQPAGESSNAGDKNSLKAPNPIAPAGQTPGPAPFQAQTERQEPMVRLPEFKVSAQRYSDLQNRLDQIDRDIRAQQLQSVPSKLDTILNNDRTSKIGLGFVSFSFGHDTAESRANEAARRMQALEMRRIIEVRLPFASPEEKKQLEQDRRILEELSVYKEPEDSFGNLNVRQRDQRNPSP